MAAAPVINWRSTRYRAEAKERAHRAVRALEQDVTLSTIAAAEQFELCESTILRYWHMRHPDAPRRPRDSFLVFCSVVLDHVHRHEQTASEIFSAVREDYGEVNDRRLWRALTWLREQGKIARQGPVGHGSVYLRVVT